MSRASRILRAVLVSALVAGLAAGAAPVTWHLLGHDAVLPPVARLEPPASAAPPRPDLGVIVSQAPFGVPAAPAESAPPEPAPSDLALLGVIVRDDPSRSLALIAHAGVEANYRVGDDVTASATLATVARDHVTLAVEGGTIRLAFSGERLAEVAEDVPTGADRLLAQITSGRGRSISERADEAAKAQPVTTQDYIDLWRERIRANPAEVLDRIGLEPIDGGYRIAERHDSGVSRAGLKAGDIVRTLNGQTIGDIETDRALYDEVAASEVARIEIERDGRSIVLSFPLR